MLLLRAAAAVAMILQARIAFRAEAPWAMLTGAIAVVAAATLRAGFMTPLAGAAAACVSLIGPAPSMIYILAIAVAIVLLGPGSLSIDARLFGRREIVLKPDS